MSYLISKEKRAKKCEGDCENCKLVLFLAPRRVCYPNQVVDYGEGVADRMASVKEREKGTHSLY